MAKARSRSRRRKLSESAKARWAAGKWPGCRKWTARELQMLGRRPDAEVAKRIGRTAIAVTGKRRELGIHLCDAAKKPTGGAALSRRNAKERKQ
jgi:hypothetical protein